MKFLLLVIVFQTTLLFSEVMKFDITYMGIPVVKSEFVYKNGSLVVTAKSNGMAKLLKHLDNKYISKYENEDSLFLPSFFKKIINQKGYSEKRLYHYQRNKSRVTMIDFLNPSESKKYDMYPNIRDFFSTLFYMRYNCKDTLSFFIDANSIIWKGFAEFQNQEKVKFNNKYISSDKYKITYKKISKDLKKENSDMLTNNLVGKGKVLYLWFTKDKNKIPIKAQFVMKPFSVFWHLKDYKK